MRRSNAPTLQDVADAAGVTVMAASVVLNGARSSTRVSETTRSRILEVATRLRYRPNAVARGLSSRCMNTIGVVAVVDGFEVNLYFLEILNGILETAAEYNQNTTVFSLQDWSAGEAKILQCCDGRVDGIILIGPSLAPMCNENLPYHTPVVVMHGDSTLLRSSSIDIDDVGGAQTIVRYLLSLGHRRILFLGGGEEPAGEHRRHIGYRHALAGEGIAYDSSLVVPCGFSIQSGRSRMTELLTQHRFNPLPTAIFCASDAVAYGCVEVLAGHGIRVPDDISVVGFDDTFTARMTAPLLTTMRQPFRQMARRAVELLLLQVHGVRQGGDRFGLSMAHPGEPSSTANGENTLCHPDETVATPALMPRTEIFAAELVVRGSTGKPPTQPFTLK